MTDDPSKACLFFSTIDPLHDRLELGDTDAGLKALQSDPHWAGGKNHVLVYCEDANFERSWVGGRLTAERIALIGKAMLWSADLYPRMIRPQFDLVLPLDAHNKGESRALRAVPAHSRRFLLTFKGTTLMGEVAYNRHHLHSLYGMESRRVEIHMLCKPHTAHMRIKSHHCRKEAAHEQHAMLTFEELLNTTFGLVPGGRQQASYRLLETLANGAIPVILEDLPFLPPLDSTIPWHTCLVRLYDEDLDKLVPMLEGLLATGRVDSLQRGCLAIYDQYFRTPEMMYTAAWNQTISFIRGFGEW